MVAKICEVYAAGNKYQTNKNSSTNLVELTSTVNAAITIIATEKNCHIQNCKPHILAGVQNHDDSAKASPPLGLLLKASNGVTNASDDFAPD